METQNKYKKSEFEGLPAIVVPTIRDKEHMVKFFNSWKEEFKGCVVHLVFDMKELPVWTREVEYDFPVILYCWKDIDNDLGDKTWIIPRKTDCVRSYGYWKAWQYKPLFIITLDDDVEPQHELLNNRRRHIEQFYYQLFQASYPPNNFYNTLKDKFPRGTYPMTTGCDVVHGGWVNVPDLSAEEQIKNSFVATDLDFNEGLIPQGVLFSMCGMNIAWKPEVTKHMYFGLQGNNHPIDRCGDIWCGYHLASKDIKVYTGKPYCVHTRASNVWSNLNKEKNAEKMSKEYSERINVYPDPLPQGEYWDKLREAYNIWEGLFNE